MPPGSPGQSRPAAPGQAVAKQQVRERFTAQGDLHPLELGEITEAVLTALVRQGKHHLGRRPLDHLPVLHAPLQGTFSGTPFLILLLLLHMLQQRGRSESWVMLQERIQQRLPDLNQRFRPAPLARLDSQGLEKARIDPLGAAQRDSRNRGSRLEATARSSFGHIQRNLMNGEGSSQEGLPCAGQPDSAQPLQTVQPNCRRTPGEWQNRTISQDPPGGMFLCHATDQFRGARAVDATLTGNLYRLQGHMTIGSLNSLQQLNRVRVTE